MRRKEQIVQCYVMATGGRLPASLEALLGAMRATMPELTESEVRTARRADVVAAAVAAPGRSA